MADLGHCGDCNLYDHYISDNLLELSAINLCWNGMHKIVKVCKSVCCRTSMCLRKPCTFECAKTCEQRTSDLLYKNPHFFVITRPNQMEFSLKCRKIVIFSLHDAYTLISLTTLKVIHAESPIVIFLGTYGIAWQ